MFLMFVKVTKRSRELSYDLEKQWTSSLNDGRLVASELEGGLALLAAATSNLTGLANMAVPGANTNKCRCYKYKQKIQTNASDANTNKCTDYFVFRGICDSFGSALHRACSWHGRSGDSPFERDCQFLPPAGPAVLAE